MIEYTRHTTPTAGLAENIGGEMTESVSPLTGAIVRLLDSIGWDDDTWAGFLNADPRTLADIRRGVAFPSDQMMTSIICQVRRVQKSKHATEAAPALEAFWELLGAYEHPGGIPANLLDLDFEPGETVVQRLTRWTSSDRLGVAIDHLHRVPLAQRHDALAEVIDVLGKYVY